MDVCAFTFAIDSETSGCSKSWAVSSRNAGKCKAIRHLCENTLCMGKCSCFIDISSEFFFHNKN